MLCQLSYRPKSDGTRTRNLLLSMDNRLTSTHQEFKLGEYVVHTGFRALTRLSYRHKCLVGFEPTTPTSQKLTDLLRLAKSLTCEYVMYTGLVSKQEVNRCTSTRTNFNLRQKPLYGGDRTNLDRSVVECHEPAPFDPCST